MCTTRIGGEAWAEEWDGDVGRRRGLVGLVVNAAGAACAKAIALDWG